MLKYRALTHLDSPGVERRKSDPGGGGGGPCLYLVEERKSTRQFVMRKMEVADSEVADRARVQFDDITSLPGDERVAEYVECFVSWSKLDAALYLCLVGEYFPGGSVRELLGLRRDRGTLVGEGEVRRWYAQMLEGLERIHREGRVHRRVKSSNVFVRDGGMVLGCMGLQTEESDIKRDMRHLLPPELRRCDSPELSGSFDVWCLGLVLLEICSSGILPWRDVLACLARENQEEMEAALMKMLDSVEKNFSTEVTNAISSCLHSNPASRHTVNDLCKLSFTQDCLSLINSPLLTRIRSQETENIPTPPSLPCPLPEVIQYMKGNLIVHQCQVIGLELLFVCVSEYGGKLSNSDKRFVRELLLSHRESMLFTLAVVRLFVAAVYEDDPMEILLTQPFVELVADIIITQLEATELFSACCIFLLLVSNHEQNASIISNHKVVPHLLSVAGPTSDNAVSNLPHVCSLLWSLTVLPDNLTALTELNGLEWTISIAKLHTSDESVLLPTMNLLWSLFQDEINLERAYYYGTIDICINSLKIHSSISNLSVSILNVLALVCKLMSCAFQLLSNESYGLLTLLGYIENSYSHHGSQEAIVRLLNVLIEFEDLKEELISLGIGDILVEKNGAVPHDGISELLGRMSQT